MLIKSEPKIPPLLSDTETDYYTKDQLPTKQPATQPFQNKPLIFILPFKILRKLFYSLKRPDKTFAFLFFLPYSLLLALTIRMLKQFIHIRFGYIDSGRIGYICRTLEFYLSKKDAASKQKKCYDIFYWSPFSACNKQIHRMWKRTVRYSPISYWAYRLNKILPDGPQHTVTYEGRCSWSMHDIWKKTQAHLNFSEKELLLGKGNLSKMGIPHTAPYVCFVARDAAYLKKTFSKNNWDYHSYRDTDVNQCLPAIDYLTEKGYYGIRMGSIVNTKLNSSNVKIINYTSHFRNEIMDVYLAAHCRIFLTPGTGFDDIAKILRRPVVTVNLIPVKTIIWSMSNVVFIPKKLWLKKDRRFLTFKEILSTDIGWYCLTEQYKQSGIEVIDNSAEEIRSAVIEADQRIDNQYTDTPEIMALQKRFIDLFPGTGKLTTPPPLISAEFLKRNRK